MQHAVLSRNGRNLDQILGCRKQSLSGRDFVLDSQEVCSQLLFSAVEAVRLAMT